MLRIQQLLTPEELGDRSPAQMLGQMVQLLDETVTAADSLILRQLLLQRLPRAVCMMSGTATGISLKTLASYFLYNCSGRVDRGPAFRS